jgi:TRAP-type transport system small permease protein
VAPYNGATGQRSYIFMNIMRAISRWSGYVACAVTFLMMMLTVCDVSGRYFFNSPITGTTEITMMMMIMVVFPALGWAATTHMHVKVTILVDRINPRIKMFLSIIGVILSFCIYALITWRCFIEASQVSKQTSLVHIPFAPFYWVMAIGLAIFCLGMLVVMIEEIREVNKK